MTEPTILIVQHEAEVYARELGAAHPSARFATAATAGEALARGIDAQVVIGLAQDISPALVASLHGLRWICALTTGTDPIDALDLPDHVVVTSGRGIHGPQVSELCFHHMLALFRQTPRMAANQATRTWERWPQRLLLGKTLAVIGVGAISEELAVRARCFGMNTLGVSSARTEARGFDRIVPRERLLDAAVEADVLVVLVPLTADTRGMVGDAVFAAMRPDAFVINLARGPVVDAAALLRHLASGSIGGAGLDVFDVEPLPADDPLWSAPNLVITPHLGGLSDTYARQIMPLLVENLGHFLAGREADMRNLVPRKPRSAP